ncbi:hypothetical protein F4820DRAFT_349855 [Hypoxylon rubiginosum]|uniref:Uncharacterized protein n=1 Tax=Hypoxylon rubiginosum TaxID=110542 RepID=A0ACB9YYH6_9PEZI|nr:hypothetical protein F4820DRAFT_349855 [Hypoxylon rubiginosum]
MRAQEFRGSGHSHRRSQDKFIIVEPGPNLFNTKENRQSPKEQLRQLESNNNSSAVTTPSGILSGPSTRPSSPISSSVQALQSRAQSLSPPRQQRDLNSRLSLDVEDLCPPTDIIPSCRESWNYEILADLGESRRSGVCSDLSGSPSDVFPWTSDWSILLNGSAHTSRLPTPSLTATPTVDHPGPRPSMAPTANMEREMVLGAGPTSAPCNCLQHLTMSVFDLNSWTANHHHRSDSADTSHMMMLGKFLSIHRDRMATFEHLCNTCLSQPDSAQLLIVNIEQLADLQEKQMNHLQEETSSFPTDTIVIGSFVVDHTLDRVVIARQLLAARKAKFIRVLESLRSRLMAAGMSDCYHRLDMILERLNKCRVGQLNVL